MQTSVIPSFIDLSVFDTDFDPHKRARQCKNVVSMIAENKPATKAKRASKPERQNVLSSANRKTMLDYSAHLIKRVKRGEIGFSSFEKNLTEAWGFCLSLKDKDVRKVKPDEVFAWWNRQTERYENKEIAHASLEKIRNCLISLFQFVNGQESREKPDQLRLVRLPKKPKVKLADPMPTQADIKRLIEAAYLDGKKFSIRDQAILALANDSGARISEILSMRNKHVRPEENYLVVSFPESKTTPRTVISILAKPYLEAWAKVSPNKNAEPDAYLFCGPTGEPTTYAAVCKSLYRALDKAAIPWKKGKSMHYFRALCASRFFEWPYSLKHAWFGWAFKDHEAAYTQITHKQFVETYTATLHKEKNPFLSADEPFWSQGKFDDKLIGYLLEKDEFRVMVRQAMRELAR